MSLSHRTMPLVDSNQFTTAFRWLNQWRYLAILLFLINTIGFGSSGSLSNDSHHSSSPSSSTPPPSPPPPAPACPDEVTLFFKTELCLEPLSEHSNTSQHSAITPKARLEACRRYNKSMECVQQLWSGCENFELGESYHGNQGAVIISGLKRGLGALCEDEHVYQLYVKHRGCYARQEEESRGCTDTFSNDIATVMKHHKDDGTDIICRSFQHLIYCLVRIVDRECGTEAAHVFEGLVHAHVPSHITGLCQDTYIKDRTSTAPFISLSSGGYLLFSLSLYSICFHF